MAKMKVHVNPVTGQMGKCTATVRGCKFAEDGAVPPHFDNFDDARVHSEKLMADRYEKQSVVKKPGFSNYVAKDFDEAAGSPVKIANFNMSLNKAGIDDALLVARDVNDLDGLAYNPNITDKQLDTMLVTKGYRGRFASDLARTDNERYLEAVYHSDNHNLRKGLFENKNFPLDRLHEMTKKHSDMKYGAKIIKQLNDAGFDTSHLSGGKKNSNDAVSVPDSPSDVSRDFMGKNPYDDNKSRAKRVSYQVAQLAASMVDEDREFFDNYGGKPMYKKNLESGEVLKRGPGAQSNFAMNVAKEMLRQSPIKGVDKVKVENSLRLAAEFNTRGDEHSKIMAANHTTTALMNIQNYTYKANMKRSLEDRTSASALKHGKFTSTDVDSIISDSGGVDKFVKNNVSYNMRFGPLVGTKPVKEFATVLKSNGDEIKFYSVTPKSVEFIFNGNVFKVRKGKSGHWGKAVKVDGANG